MPICRARIGLKHFQKAIEKFGILGILGILGIPERELCSNTEVHTRYLSRLWYQVPGTSTHYLHIRELFNLVVGAVR